MPVPHYGYSSVQESKEDHRQTHAGRNINCYHQCTMNVNSFNVYNTTMEDCYNNTPVTRSSFFPLLQVLSPSNLNNTILLLETLTDYPSRLTVRISFSTAAGLVVSFILAIYLCGKEFISITSRFYKLIFILDKFRSHITISFDKIKQAAQVYAYSSIQA